MTLKKSLRKVGRLVLKCDGLYKNKNIPKYVADVLLKKYTKISSIHGVYVYDLEIWFELLLV